MQWTSLLLVLFCSSAVQGFQTPNWDEDYALIMDDRSNIYQLSDQDLAAARSNGFEHAHRYPVSVSGIFVPEQSFRNFFEVPPSNPFKQILLQVAEKVSGYETEEDFYRWLGLVSEPQQLREKNIYLGAGIVDAGGVRALTFSCFTCHASSFFGKTVLGLQNRRSKANELFVVGKKLFTRTSPGFFSWTLNSSKKDELLYARTRDNIQSVTALAPQVLGLDTSLAQVALSLAHRKLDPEASKSKYLESFPRTNALEHFVADSKPMPWWNLKWKTRWLSDGSIVSGNPIFTNFLWNEIGRGTDLVELRQWLESNQKVIQDLTAYVFATPSPRWHEFFPENQIDIPKAQRGEKHFQKMCASCHGNYEKGWNSLPTSSLHQDLTATTRTIYHSKTPVLNVGTDPQRYQGMVHFAEELNQLSISKWMKTVVKPQKGYVPPPLAGIWARYPYLHNNSVPNLCALMTPPKLRPKWFIQGPAENPKTDFDFECVGYPTGDQIPSAWHDQKEALYQTNKPGLSNQGHYQMFLDEAGDELLTWDEKLELIEFLKTL